MSDIVARLRAEAKELDFDAVSDLLNEAAAEIERAAMTARADKERGEANTPSPAVVEALRHVGWLEEHIRQALDALHRFRRDTGTPDNEAAVKCLERALAQAGQPQEGWRPPKSAGAKEAERLRDLVRRFLQCPEIADCAPVGLDQETRALERRARAYLALAAPSATGEKE